MKITDAILTLFQWKGLHDATDRAYGAALGDSVCLGLLRIMTNEGPEGNALLGSSVWSAHMDAESIITFLKPLLIGKDPFAREAIHRELTHWSVRRRTTMRAIAAVDIALWDIAGKTAGLPVYCLMGSSRDSIPAYASSQSLPSILHYTEEAIRYKDAGWQAYKIHPPTKDWKEDLLICQEVRRAVGSSYTLMLDAMWSYSYPQALQVGRELNELRFEWFEDPLPENDLYNYRKLCEKLDIPVMATEYPEVGLDGYAAWIDACATDLLRGDVAVKGGITPVLKAAHLAEAFGLGFEIHHGANSHNNFANLHIALSAPNCRYFEVMLPDQLQKYGIVNDIEVDAKGLVHAPRAPGIGAQIDMDKVSRGFVAELR